MLETFSSVLFFMAIQMKSILFNKVVLIQELWLFCMCLSSPVVYFLFIIDSFKQELTFSSKFIETIQNKLLFFSCFKRRYQDHKFKMTE